MAKSRELEQKLIPLLYGTGICLVILFLSVRSFPHWYSIVSIVLFSVLFGYTSLSWFHFTLKSGRLDSLRVLRRHKCSFPAPPKPLHFAHALFSTNRTDGMRDRLSHPLMKH